MVQVPQYAKEEFRNIWVMELKRIETVKKKKIDRVAMAPTVTQDVPRHSKEHRDAL